MIALFLVSLVLAAVLLVYVKRFGFPARAAIALGVFVLVNAPSIIVLLAGDRSQEGARTVNLQQLQSDRAERTK